MGFVSQLLIAGQLAILSAARLQVPVRNADKNQTAFREQGGIGFDPGSTNPRSRFHAWAMIRVAGDDGLLFVSG